MKQRLLLIFSTVSLLNAGKTFCQEIDPTIFYRLSTKWQGESKVLEVINDGFNNRLQINATGYYSSQAWKLTPAGNGNYRITCSWLGTSKSLEVINDGKNDKVQLVATKNFSNQLWKLTLIEQGYYRITNAWTGVAKSLELVNDGINRSVKLSKTANYTNQWWMLKPFSQEAPVQPDKPDEVIKPNLPTDSKERVPEFTGSNVTQEEAQRALDAHNVARDLVKVPHLQWSATLAAVAQKWADKLAMDCNLVHSGGKYGENLAQGGGYNLTAYDAFLMWDSEKKLYKGEPISNATSGTGHYTQVVWKSSRYVGMGSAKCSNGAVIIVANYDPPGNYLGQRPY